MILEQYLATTRELVDKALDEILPKEDNEPVVLRTAMRYSIFAGGKRIRPILAMAAAEAVGGEKEDILPLAVALECIHTYSLIHDDLPAMDNDDYRRGKLTAHKAFGEAIAILAGDALLTFAFSILSGPDFTRRFQPQVVLEVINDVALLSGYGGLIAGQVLDITAESRPQTLKTIDAIMRNKTAALIEASVTSGAKLGGAASDQVESLRTYGRNLGIVFQIKDDLLDLEGDPSKLGKAVNKDQQKGKATYPNLLGKDKAKEIMRSHLTAALDSIAGLGDKGNILTLIGQYVGNRVS